jgi:CRISPR-associated protein Cas2
MSNTFVVSYDVCDPKRLRRVFKVMKGWGIPLQYSVFQCDLSEKQVVELKSELEDEMDMNVDQVLFIDLGPTDGRARNAIESMGKPYTFPLGGPVVF